MKNKSFNLILLSVVFLFSFIYGIIITYDKESLVSASGETLTLQEKCELFTDSEILYNDENNNNITEYES